MKQLYTTQLQAGLGMIEETKVLLEIWQKEMSVSQLNKAALESGMFSNVTARRLRNVISECFAPRYMCDNQKPAELLKVLSKKISNLEISQIFFLYTARSNRILFDFVKEVYWNVYSSGYGYISHKDAEQFVLNAIGNHKTKIKWSESTVKRVSGYLVSCCADFGLLGEKSKEGRKILHLRVSDTLLVFLSYELHFNGVPDNAILSHESWSLWGLDKTEVRDELKRLSLKGYFIVQTASDVTRLGWIYKNWEELLHVIS